MEHELYEQKKMADFILKMRKVRNLTQKDLAEKLGVTDKAVSKWERAVSSPDISPGSIHRRASQRRKNGNGPGQ